MSVPRLLGLVVAAAAATAGPRAAAADPAGSYYADEDLEPPQIADYRRGVRRHLGFDLGLGIFDGRCERCGSTGGLGIAVTAGVQVHCRVALIADLGGVVHLLPTDDRDSGVTVFGASTAGARVWLLPDLWLQAAGGVGGLARAGRGEEVSLLGPAASLSIGRELLHRPHRGIDVAVHLLGTTLDAGAGERTVFYSVRSAIGFHWN